MSARGKPRIVIVDCGHGNLASVQNAFHAVGADSHVSSDPDEIRRANAVVFPGQGAAPPAMESLESTGLSLAVRDAFAAEVPILGICLGMQLALERTSEGPAPSGTQCLGLVRGECSRFEPGPAAPKVPQIGWNQVRHENMRMFAGIPSGADFYFVHAYYCTPDPGVICATTDYGIEYCSALISGSLWATQFHPEKSGPVGLRLLDNFLRLAVC